MLQHDFGNDNIGMKSTHAGFATTVICAWMALSMIAGPGCAQLPPDANTTCPVMTEEESDPEIYVDHNGRRVYLCCAKCKREFRANPEKYLALLGNAAAVSSTALETTNALSTSATQSAATDAAPSDESVAVFVDAKSDDVAATDSGADVTEKRPPSIRKFLGRLHPAAVHLPIGLIIGAALMEAFALLRARPPAGDAARSMIGLAALASVPTALFGWLNAATTQHPDMEDVVEFHRWLGIAASAMLILLWICARGAAGKSQCSCQRSYLVLLYATAIMVIVAGHYGGVLVYGEDYYRF